MPLYRVINRETGETQEVEAPFAQTACEALGWMIGNCYVKPLKGGPLSGYTNRRQHINAKDETRAIARQHVLHPASAAEAKGWL